MSARDTFARVLSWRFWLTPGMGVKRHVAVALAGALLALLGTVLVVLWALAENRASVAVPLERWLTSGTWRRAGLAISIAAVLGGVVLAVVAIGRLNRSLISNWMPRPRDAARVLHERLSLARGPRIVAIGGGTGLSNLLRGLRVHTSNITAIVTVADDGGSSGRLRAAFGIPAPGDIADCLAALSDHEVELGRLLQYRFERGGELAGHTFGNLLITTLNEVEGDLGRAVQVLNRSLNLQGSVVPATAAPVTLRARKKDGETVEGESSLREVRGPVHAVALAPSDPPALPEALAAIEDADLIVLGPGSLFSSTIPPLLVPDLRDSLLASDAELVYVCNIMTEAGETDGFTVVDHVDAIEAHLGRAPDVVLVNDRPVDAARLEAYRTEGALEVEDDAADLDPARVDVVRLPLLGDGVHAQHESSAVARWLVERCGSARPNGAPA